MPFCFKPVYKWSVNVLRVSSPLKLRNTSNFLLLKEEEEEEEGDDEDDGDDNGRRDIKKMDEHKQLQILKIASLTENHQKQAQEVGVCNL